MFLTLSLSQPLEKSRFATQRWEVDKPVKEMMKTSHNLYLDVKISD